MDSSRPNPGWMEETLVGGRGPTRAVVPLERERERERERDSIALMLSSGSVLIAVKQQSLHFSLR
jgi:hypothetical protein